MKVQPIRILIVRDQPVTALGLHTLLSQQSDMEVVGHTTSGEGVLDKVAQIQPQVLLLDCYLIHNPADIITREVSSLDMPVEIMAVNPIIDEPHLKCLLEAGARGYMLTTEPLESITNAVRNVSAGKMWLSSPLVNRLLEQETRKIDQGESLTRREREVLALMFKGHTNMQIAEHLSIAVGTVKNHLKIIYAKLGVHTRVEALLLAWEYGLVEK
jgi:two-component system, NarL family, response regulator LiaR